MKESYSNDKSIPGAQPKERPSSSRSSSMGWRQEVVRRGPTQERGTPALHSPSGNIKGKTLRGGAAAGQVGEKEPHGHEGWGAQGVLGGARHPELS